MPVAIVFTSADRSALQSIAKLEAKIINLDQKLKGVGTTGRRSSRKIKDSFGSKMRNVFKTLAGAAGIGTVVGAIAVVNRGYDTWLRNIREIATAANQTQKDVVDFAALQAPGTKQRRQDQALTLGARFGISDQALLTDTIQAIQSELPDSRSEKSFQQALKGAAVVFKSTLLGVTLEAAREVEVAAASLGAKPGEFTRKAFAAGLASGRTPEDIAQGVFAIPFFSEDKDLGFAALATLAAAVPKGKLRVFGSRAGKGLSAASSGIELFDALAELQTAPPADFEKAARGLNLPSKLSGEEFAKILPTLDVGNQRGRLKALAALGVNTTEELAVAGFGEIREQRALSILVSNIDKVFENERFILENAVPGILDKLRAEIDAELPQASLQRQSAIADAAFKQEQTTGNVAKQKQLQDLEQKINALAFKKLGLEQAGIFDLIETGEGGAGRSTRFDILQARLFGEVSLEEFTRAKDEVIRERGFTDVRTSRERSLDSRIEALELKQERFGRGDPEFEQSEQNIFFQTMIDELKGIRANTDKAGGGATLGRVDEDPGAGARG